MSMKELYAKPGHLLRRAHQISVAIFTEECSAYDLTSVQYAALVAIQENPGVDATRLAGLIAFDRSTLGGVLERLEAKDFIRRKPSPDDKRVKLLYLTPQGKDLINEVESSVMKVQERLMEPLRREDRKTLVRLLTELVHLHKNTLPSSLRLVFDRAAQSAAEHGQTTNGDAVEPAGRKKTLARKAVTKKAARTS